MTTEHIPSRKTDQLVKAFKNSQSLYIARGFHVHTALMDGEFVALKLPLANVQVRLNITAIGIPSKRTNT